MVWEIERSRPSWESLLTQFCSGGSDSQKSEWKDSKITIELVDRPVFPPEELHKIVALATCPPQETNRPVDRWTISDLTKEVIQQKIAEISPSSVWRLLDQAALKPHKWVYWLNSPDPNFEPKMLHQ